MCESHLTLHNRLNQLSNNSPPPLKLNIFGLNPAPTPTPLSKYPTISYVQTHSLLSLGVMGICNVFPRLLHVTLEAVFPVLLVCPRVDVVLAL